MDDDAIEEVFAPLGPVTIRRMFGGKGVYHRGLIVAVDLGGELMLKGDAETAAAVEAAGSRQWCYDGKARRTVRMPYWSIPDGALDDPDALEPWLRLAYAAALRAPRKGRR